MKRLYRSRENRIFAGIIGGLGDYTGIDPVALRLVFIFAVLATGIVPGVIAYLIAIFVVPIEPDKK
jgi:phage shock protein C